MSGWNRGVKDAKRAKIQAERRAAARRVEHPKPCERCFAPLLTDVEIEAGLHSRHVSGAAVGDG